VNGGAKESSDPHSRVLGFFLSGLFLSAVRPIVLDTPTARTAGRIWLDFRPSLPQPNYAPLN